MGVGRIYRCGCKEVYIIIDFLILLIPIYTILVSAIFGSSIPTFLFIFVN